MPLGLSSEKERIVAQSKRFLYGTVKQEWYNCGMWFFNKVNNA